MAKKYDFSGWATRNDLRCSDGRTIRHNAFVDDDGKKVPLVWQHKHDSPENVLGHAILENRDNGVYAYCCFNSTPLAQHSKELVQHGDICALSIYANQLKQNGGDVLHGSIKEVSLVLAGANPGALIDFPTLEHGEESEEEVFIYTGKDLRVNKKPYISHEDEEDEEEYDEEEYDDEEEEEDEDDEIDEDEAVEVFETLTDDQKDAVYYLVGRAVQGDMAHEEDEEEETVQDVFDTLTEKQKKVVYYLVAQAAEGAFDEDGEDDEEMAQSEDYEGEDDTMKHNVFESGENNEKENSTLSHSETEAIFADAKRCGSLSEAVLAHTAEYGIDQIAWLFPDYKEMNVPPEYIKRDQTWVGRVMNGIHHTPFSRIKTTFADITEDEARALGYIKGNEKKNEVFTLLKRTTDPQTIYKHQMLDRDDVNDITGFDVVAWIKTEMRMMLDEEIARAILVGDGRDTSSNDHISQDHVRSIFNDVEKYAIHKKLTAVQGEAEAKTFIKTILRSWKEYKGSGNCLMFTTEDMLTDMLLLEDGMGHFMYPNKGTLATTLRVNDIITVPVMSATTTVRVDATDSKTYKPLAIIVNLNDYNVGADKGGAINMFEDFDIDYNQHKYLIETRISGALTKPYGAIVIEKEVPVEENAPAAQ